ncbi:MAG: ZIP family metal transporter [Gammaproteobacteria bacterium]|nr:ZIP family metal transporter [Gammaproteobacteria bacterium]
MESNLPLLLIGYAAGVFMAAIIGGRISELGRMTHTRMQMVMSFVAGFILGMAVFHLLPHSLERIEGHEGIVAVAGWMVLGMVVMVILLRVFQFHQHDLSPEAGDLYGGGDRGHDRGRASISSGSLLGIALGLSLHTVTEGVALGTSITIDEGLLPGLAVFIAIMLHKPLDAYSIIGIMQSVGYSRRARNLANFAFALLCPLVAAASFWGVGMMGPLGEGVVIGYTLAFAAGAFLCISLSDLLPEIQFHSHDRGKLLLAFLFGIGLACGLSFIEGGTVHELEAH